VVDAILSLLHETGEVPAVSEVAARSGVSVRSVFRHFDDIESLHAAAVERHMAALVPRYAALPMSGPLAERVAGLAAHRSALFEEIGPIRVVAERLESQSGAVARGLVFARRALRDQLAALFAEELQPLSADDRVELLHALDAVSGWDFWHHLRTLQGCSVARSRAIVTRTVNALLRDG